MEGAFTGPCVFGGRGAFTSPGHPLCSRYSNFSSRRTQTYASPNVRAEGQNVCIVYMKKGRFHAPLRPQQQNQLKLPEDGTPVFAIFVRTPRAKIWYPLGAVQGDGRSKSLVDALKGGLGKNLYQNALDRGIAQTVYGTESVRFLQNAIKRYPQLKKYQRELEFGYRVMAQGLEDQKTKAVSKDMALPFFAWMKKRIDNALKSLKN